MFSRARRVVRLMWRPVGIAHAWYNPAAAVKGGKNVKAAGKFLAFLGTLEAAGVFAGYRIVPQAAAR